MNRDKIIKYLSDYKEILESIGPAGEDKATDEEIVELGILIGRLCNDNVEIIGTALNRAYLAEWRKTRQTVAEPVRRKG